MPTKDEKRGPGRPEKGRKRYNITLPPDLHEQAKAEAERRGETISELIETALRKEITG